MPVATGGDSRFTGRYRAPSTGPGWARTRGDPRVRIGSADCNSRSTAANVELVYGYNGPLVTSEQWIGDTAGTVSRVFNNRGLVTSQQINGSSTAAFTYDDDDLLLTAGSVTLSRSATTGQTETVTLSNIIESLSYDAFGDVDGSTVVYSSGPTDLYEYALEREQLGRIIEETKIVDGGTPEVWTYEYDERGRLERVEVDSTLYAEYDYDPNGNRLSVTTTGGTTYATYDEQDRIIDYGDWEYTHGANGEIISKSDGVDTWAYEYDALGNLRMVTLPDDTEVRYEYDGRGRPVARYVDDVYVKGWLWGNQLEPVAEVDDQGAIVARYVYGSRGHVPDYVVKGGVTYRIITDFRGSVVRVVKASDGDPVQEIEYGPWGEVLSQSGPADFQSFGYAGGIWDEDTGLVLFGARWYDTGLGRWVMKDPILFGGGQANFYVYVENDPTDLIDPSGLTVKRCRIPFVPFLPLGPDITHQYLMTDNHSFGLWTCNDASPIRTWLRNFFGSMPSCVTNMSWPDAICEEVKDVDESCVDSYSPVNGEYQWTSDYQLLLHNCQDYVDDVVGLCSTGTGPRQDCGSLSCKWMHEMMSGMGLPSG